MSRSPLRFRFRLSRLSLCKCERLGLRRRLQLLELEYRNLLPVAVFDNLEVLRFEICNRTAVLVANTYVHDDEIRRYRKLDGPIRFLPGKSQDAY